MPDFNRAEDFQFGAFRTDSNREQTEVIDLSKVMRIADLTPEDDYNDPEQGFVLQCDIVSSRNRIYVFGVSMSDLVSRCNIAKDYAQKTGLFACDECSRSYAAGLQGGCGTFQCAYLKTDSSRRGTEYVDMSMVSSLSEQSSKTNYNDPEQAYSLQLDMLAPKNRITVRGLSRGQCINMMSDAMDYKNLTGIFACDNCSRSAGAS